MKYTETATTATTAETAQPATGPRNGAGKMFW